MSQVDEVLSKQHNNHLLDQQIFPPAFETYVEILYVWVKISCSSELKDIDWMLIWLLPHNLHEKYTLVAKLICQLNKVLGQADRLIRKLLDRIAFQRSDCPRRFDLQIRCKLPFFGPIFGANLWSKQDLVNSNSA